MGKMRKTKPHAAAAISPTGLQSLRDAGFDEELFDSEAHPDGPITAIVEQLQSVSVEDKMCALQALSFLCQAQQRIAEIQDSDIVKIIASWLLDPNRSIRQATAGALRNLSVCGVEVCEQLVERDVLTPLLALFAEYAADATWVPTFDRSVGDQLDERGDTFLQAIHLLANLCESTQLALDPFNQTTLVASLVRCLDARSFGADIALAVAQSLLIISEDNATAWRLLNGYRAELSALLRPESVDSAAPVFLATLAAGIVSNVPALADGQTAAVFAVLGHALAFDTRARLSALSSEMPVTRLSRREQEMFVVEAKEDGGAGGAAEAMEQEEDDAQANLRRRRDDQPTGVETAVKEAGWWLSAQRVAGEIITNMCSTEEEGEAGEWEDEDDGEMVHDYDTTATNGLNGSLQNTDQLPEEIVAQIRALGLVEKLWQRAQPLPENVLEILAITDAALPKKCNTLRISALLCLQNLCNVMSVDDLGGASAVYAVWLDLGQTVFRGQQPADQLEASTALMRATLEHLRPSAALFAQMTADDLQLMLDGVQQCGSEPEIRANWLRMLGVLGVLLPAELGQRCMACIVQTACGDEDAWTISEAADALMDMFSDNDWQQAVADLGLVRQAQELLVQLMACLRRQRRELGDRYAAVCTVRTNLARFVKYMEEEQVKFRPAAAAATNGKTNGK